MHTKVTPPHDYLQGLEINEAAAMLHPNNCAVRERTDDGVPVGVRTHHLKDGTTCPRHGCVKQTAQQS